MTDEPTVEGSAPEGSGAEGSGAEGSGAEGSGAEGSEPVGPGAEGSEPDGPTEPTLQEEFAELTPVLTSTMFGTSAQRISGLILLIVVMVALLIGLKTLPTVPLAGAPAPTPTSAPSSWIGEGRLG